MIQKAIEKSKALECVKYDGTNADEVRLLTGYSLLSGHGDCLKDLRNNVFCMPNEWIFNDPNARGDAQAIWVVPDYKFNNSYQLLKE